MTMKTDISTFFVVHWSAQINSWYKIYYQFTWLEVFITPSSRGEDEDGELSLSLPSLKLTLDGEGKKE